MEVLLGIQQLFTHSLEHKNWADETDSLTEKEGAWTHHRHQFFFFPGESSETANKENISPTS